uniref:Uncharacterized protein n=1 Tax=Aegilops tauschii TaxID=37682 RepID=M8BU66_AEGTA
MATVGRRPCSPLLHPPTPRELHWPPVRARSKAGGPARRRVGETPQPRRFAEFGIDYKPAMWLAGTPNSAFAMINTLLVVFCDVRLSGNVLHSLRSLAM